MALPPLDRKSRAIKSGLFGAIGYRPHPGQENVHFRRWRFMVQVCGRRWGKSTAAAREIDTVLARPGTRAWVVAPTYDLAEKTFRVVWNDLVAGGGLDRDDIISKSYSDLYLATRWGSVLEGKSADNPDSLVGEALDFLVIDEAARVGPLVWQQYLRPSLSDRLGRALFISTPKGLNWFYDAFRNGQLGLAGDKRWAAWCSFRSPSWDNPYLPIDDIEEARDTLDPNVFAQECGAEFTSQAGLVYPAFDTSTHVFRDFPGGIDEWTVFENWDAWAGVDFGFANPFVHLWAFRSPDGEVYIYDELYQNRRTVPQLAGLITRREESYGRPIRRWRYRVCDPSNPGARAEMADLGIRLVPAAYPLNAVQEGINDVRALLALRENGTGGGGARPRLYFHRRCENTIREMMNYCYPEGIGDRNPDEEPVKRDDHAMDALRYLVRTAVRPSRSLIRL